METFDLDPGNDAWLDGVAYGCKSGRLDDDPRLRHFLRWGFRPASCVAVGAELKLGHGRRCVESRAVFRSTTRIVVVSSGEQLADRRRPGHASVLNWSLVFDHRLKLWLLRTMSNLELG